jgi:nitrate reductase NapAB chaperone NapD
MSDMTSRFGKRTKDVLFSLGAITKQERDANRGAGDLIKFVESKMEDELKEAYSTIETLKSELNEINLLNAKLLYTNKIFKSKNLNENQKVKVLSSFDKATTVGEVKMVFETLNEGIKVNKNTIKENLGSASKAMVTPNAKKPIVESNDAFLRMQKLAGII